MVSCGSFTIESQFDPGSVSIQNCQVSPGSITPGEQVTASWDWVNDNDVDAEVGYSVAVDGTQLGSNSAVVSATNPGSGSIPIDTTGLGTGDHSVEITLTASPAASGSTASAQPTSLRTDGGSSRLTRFNSCQSCGH